MGELKDFRKTEGDHAELAEKVRAKLRANC